MLSRYGAWSERIGREGSAATLERAFRLDPFGFVPTLFRSSSLIQRGRWLDAAAVIETTLVGNQDDYTPNNVSAFVNIAVANMIQDDDDSKDARLAAAEAQIRRARLVAHPVDFSLDVMEMIIAATRADTPMSWREILDRAKTERLDGLMQYALYGNWSDGELLAEAIQMAIDQRSTETWRLYGPKPSNLPGADWRRFRSQAGIDQFQPE